MSRMMFLLLFVACSSRALETPPEIAERANNRMIELYNAGKFEQLAAELYTEDAVSEFEGSGPTARGRDEIVKIWKTYAGQITLEKLEILDVVDNSLFAVGVMWQIVINGETTPKRFQSDETFVNGKIAYERTRRLE